MILLIGKRNRRSNFASQRLNCRGCKIKGFTLIELILVILLISILTALSTPLFRRTFSDLVLRNASFDVAKIVNYAQEMAIIEKVNYRLNLDRRNGRYWLTRYKLAEGGNFLYERIRGRYGKIFFLPDGITFVCNKSEISFYPDGRSDKARIKLFDEKTKEACLLDIKGFGNRVKIEIIR